jgi:hypothetical protein
MEMIPATATHAQNIAAEGMRRRVFIGFKQCTRSLRVARMLDVLCATAELSVAPTNTNTTYAMH